MESEGIGTSFTFTPLPWIRINASLVQPVHPMLPKQENTGKPHRELTTFQVHEGERVFIASEDPDGILHEKLRVQESGRFGVVPLPEDIEATIVDPTDLEDVDIGEMRIVGDAVGIEETDLATVEMRVDGQAVADSHSKGVYGLLWVPISP